MSRKSVLITVLILAFVGGGYWLYRKVSADETPKYRFATVERGDLEAAVSATGALSAVTTVQVGTQVSGQISEINVDFNGRVRKGQLIARIDPTLAQQAVRDAQANLDRMRAERERTQLEYERNQRLFDNKVLTEVEFNTAKYAYEVAQASAKSAEVALERARRNLEYTSILSPIDGIVVERNVDVGQTVAANYSTPQLFLIAQDLSRMQILAQVDESDIGRIAQGQTVRFSVQAYPDRQFEGTVAQVRLQSKVVENVVNYTVAVAVDNSDKKLLPGMTATVEFQTGSAKNVLIVPNTALRFRPPEAMLAKMREEMAAARGERAGADGAGRADGGAVANGADGFQRSPGKEGSTSAGRLWHLDEQGKLRPLRVHTGITDGQKTEVSGKGVQESMQVVIGVTQDTTGQQSGTSLFSQPGGQGRPPGRF